MTLVISEGDLVVTKVMMIPKQSFTTVNSLALDFFNSKGH